MPGFEDFGKESKEDKNNIAPRAGFTLRRARATARFVVRGGVGRYYDFAYTNANILFAVCGAQSSFGQVYLEHQQPPASATPTGASSRSASRCRRTSSRTEPSPLPSHVASPRIKQPYTDQANLGFSKALGKSYAIELDAVYAAGQDLGIRPRLNVRINGGPRRFAGHPAAVRRTPTSGSTSAERPRHYKGVSCRAQEAVGRQAAAAGLVLALRGHLAPACARPTSSATTTSSTRSTRSRDVRRTRPAPTRGTA